MVDADNAGRDRRLLAFGDIPYVAAVLTVPIAGNGRISCWHAPHRPPASGVSATLLPWRRGTSGGRAFIAPTVPVRVYSRLLFCDGVNVGHAERSISPHGQHLRRECVSFLRRANIYAGGAYFLRNVGHAYLVGAMYQRMADKRSIMRTSPPNLHAPRYCAISPAYQLLPISCSV